MTVMIAYISEDDRSVHPKLRGLKVVGHVEQEQGEWTQLELIGPYYIAQDGERGAVRVWVATEDLSKPVSHEQSMMIRDASMNAIYCD